MKLQLVAFLTAAAVSGAILSPAFAASSTAAMTAAKPAASATMAKSAKTDPKRFPTEAAASAACPTGTVVWANTHSKIYHLKGTATYGKGKNGVYMCQTDATAEGFKAPKKPEKMVSSAK